jgi:hypothetical protein
MDVEGRFPHHSTVKSLSHAPSDLNNTAGFVSEGSAFISHAKSQDSAFRVRECGDFPPDTENVG